MKQSTIAIVAALAVVSPAIINVEKTVWVMCIYGARHLAWGLPISSVIVMWASRRTRLSLRVALLVAATLALWIARFIAADSGYRAWQSIPNPSDEALADTGPIFFLLAGWFPSWGIVYLLLLLFQRIFSRPPVSPPGPPPLPT